MSRVLLIDDDRQLLDVLCLAFEEAGHEVATAHDGREGLAAIASERPDAIVSDVNMPNVDGFQLCRTLRAKGDRVPIVLLTSRDSEIDEALGLELGADDYVAKPFARVSFSPASRRSSEGARCRLRTHWTTRNP